MFKITAICVAGVGSSVFAKELLSQAVNMLGYEPDDFTIDAEEVSMARGVSADVVITSNALLDKVAPVMEEKKIPVVALVSIGKDPDKMAEGIRPYVEVAEAEGRVHKLGEKPVVEEPKKEKKKWSLFGRK